MSNLNIITSLSNAEIKAAASLHQKKFREQTGLYLAEGFRLINDTIAAGAQPQKMFLRQGLADSLEHYKHIRLYGHILTLVADSVLKKLSGTDSPQGIIAIFKKNSEQTFVLGKYNLVLDRISDPGNLGTILRSAAACAFNNVILYNCTDPYSPKCVRSAMGAINHLSIFSCDSAGQARKILAGSQMVCADMQGRDLFSQTTSELLHGKNIALVIGSEAHGITPDFAAADDVLIASLPMQNVESLNAAVCASVMMYTINHVINNNIKE